MEKFRKALERLKPGNGQAGADAEIVNLRPYKVAGSEPADHITDELKPRSPKKNADRNKSSKPNILALDQPFDDDGARPGWSSPSYSKSRISRIDIDLAGKQKCIHALDQNRVANDYKFLRTQILQRTRPKGLNSIMVTSVRPGEGKTLTAINLAVTFAQEYNQTVLLVDCDLKKPKIYSYLGLPGDLGLIDHLVDERPMTEIIVWPEIEKLTIISGGREMVDSTEMLGSPRMQHLVRDMKHRYSDRYIFYDVPAMLSSPDAGAFAPIVDSILLVVEHGKTRKKDIARALDLIPKEKFLGFVMNRRPVKNN